VSVEEAQTTGDQTDPAVLAPSTTATLEEQSISPALSDTGEELASHSTLTSSTISKETAGEFAVNTPAGEVSLTPVESQPAAAIPPTIVNGAAALFANTWPATDIIIRPQPLGATTLKVIQRGCATAFPQLPPPQVVSRIMRRLSPLPILVTVMLVMVASAVAAHSDHRHAAVATCPPAHYEHVYAADQEAMVYEGPEAKGLPEIFGCTYRHKHAYALGTKAESSVQGGGGIERETLAGTVVAYEKSSNGGFSHPGAKWQVVVRDLRNGRMLHKVPTGVRNDPQVRPDNGIGPTTAIVVKSDGSVAWIVQTNPGAGTYQVHALDGTGGRVLASGSDIDPSSLALAGSTLYWTQGGKPASAVLN
jgi:hypothetical protein